MALKQRTQSCTLEVEMRGDKRGDLTSHTFGRKLSRREERLEC